jgi:hypothetical protein
LLDGILRSKSTAEVEALLKNVLDEYGKRGMILEMGKSKSGRGRSRIRKRG